MASQNCAGVRRWLLWIVLFSPALLAVVVFAFARRFICDERRCYRRSAKKSNRNRERHARHLRPFTYHFVIAVVEKKQASLTTGYCLRRSYGLRLNEHYTKV